MRPHDRPGRRPDHVSSAEVSVGDVAAATVTVQNLTDEPVTCSGDGCLDLAPTQVVLDQARRPGREQVGDRAAFKAAALANGDRETVIGLVPPEFVTTLRFSAQPLLRAQLAARQTAEAVLLWRVQMPQGGRPAGPARLTSTFRRGAGVPVDPAARARAPGPLAGGVAVDATTGEIVERRLP